MEQGLAAAAESGYGGAMSVAPIESYRAWVDQQSSNFKLSHYQVRRAVVLKRGGSSAREIARLVGCHEWSVRFLLRELPPDLL